MTHASTIPAACEGEPGDRDRVRPAGGGRRLRTSARAALGLFVTAPRRRFLRVRATLPAAGVSPADRGGTGAGANRESPALARSVVVSALAGFSFVYGAYLLVLARSPL
ncbi:hypothetical protein [Streptomyces chiangmaiensis]|uniref:Uncharacterized protein n=1 Tax=Streptomyces chiangmaiensis TaxID=766497 RepID=A0ABU7FFL9_9ACTN|nr:hypothetical protein [Streptomyces chiangmaiensis]MED7822623.1 hypothetical protein [Streptomyces chiangmaiensis]